MGLWPIISSILKSQLWPFFISDKPIQEKCKLWKGDDAGCHLRFLYHWIRRYPFYTAVINIKSVSWFNSSIWFALLREGVLFLVSSLVSAVRTTLCSAPWFYSDGGGQLHRSCFHGNMVQHCRVSENPNSVCATPAPSPARDSLRCRSGNICWCISVLTLTVWETWILMPLPPVSPADSLSHGVLTDLQFEEEGAEWPGKSRESTPQQASHTVRMLCSLTSDPELVGLKCNRFQSAFTHWMNPSGILMVCFSLSDLDFSYCCSFSNEYMNHF